MLCETADPRVDGRNAEEMTRNYQEAVEKVLKSHRRRGDLAEEKYDGTMGFICKEDGKVTVQNRHGVDYTRRTPDLVEAAKQIPGNFTVQGEIVYHNPETGEIEFTPCQRRCSTQDLTKVYYLMHVKKFSLDFYAWSLLSLNGENMENWRYIDQKEALRKLIPEGNRIRYTPHRFDLEQFFEETKRKQREGIVMKRVDGGYEHSRSFSWLKLKNWRFKDCDVVGYTPGKNARSHFWGALVLSENGKFVGTAGSGPSDWELRQVKDILDDAPKVGKPFDIGEPYISVRTDLKVLVKYYKITKAGVMRFPIFEKIVSTTLFLG